MAFSSHRAVSYIAGLEGGDQAAAAVMDRWAEPGWRETVNRIGKLAELEGRSAAQARNVALALVCARQDVLAAMGVPDDGSEPPERENISGWWTRFKKRAKKAVGSGWDAFADTLGDAFKNLGDWDSFRDILDNVKLVATGGGTAIGDAATAAAESALNEALGPYLKQMGGVMARAYGKSRTVVVDAVGDFIRSKTKSDFLEDLARELTRTTYDILWGYPQCLCEYACAKPLTDGLRKAGGVPAIIGSILSGIYPALQLQSAPWDAPALYLYSERLPLLPKAKLSDEGIVGGVLDLIGDRKDASISAPRAFDDYSPWLVDMVALGAPGPTVLTDSKPARWYFEHPESALSVLEDAGKIDNAISGLFKWLGKIDRLIEIIQEARKYGQTAMDTVKAIDTGSLKQSLSAAVRDTVNRESVEQLGGWAVEKQAKPLAQRELKRQVRRAIDELGIRKYLDEADKIYRRASVYVPKAPPLDGSISGSSEAFLETWMPATIGLQARAKYGVMVELWAHLTQAEREKWKTAPHSYWKTKATDFPAWYKKLSKDPRVADYTFELEAPYKYQLSASAGDDWWVKILEKDRDAMRSGKTTTLFFLEFAGRTRIPKSPTVPPSLRDVGWPLGFERPNGTTAKTGQYYAWRQDWLDIHDPERFKSAIVYYDKLWSLMSIRERQAWLQSTPKGVSEPAVAFEPKLVRAASAEAPKLRVTTGPTITRRRFWALQMIRLYPESLKTLDAKRVGDIAKATQTAWAATVKTVERFDNLANVNLAGIQRGLQLSQRVLARPWLLPQAELPDTPPMGASVWQGGGGGEMEKVEEVKRSLVVPVVLGGVGVVLLGLGLFKR